MENKHIIWIIIGLIALIFILPKLGLFSIYTAGFSFPTDTSTFGSGQTQDVLNFQYSSSPGIYPFPSPFCPTCTESSMNYPANMNFASKIRYNCNADYTSCSSNELAFDLFQPDNQLINGKIEIPASLKLYYYGSAGTSNKIYYSINTPISCNTQGCTGTYIGTGGNMVHYYIIDLTAYKGQEITSINVASYDYVSSNKYGGNVIMLTTNFKVRQDSCTPVSCASTTCTGQTCTNNCGTIEQGTKTCETCQTDIDANCNNLIDRAELGTAINNYIAGTLSRAKLGIAIQSYVGGTSI